MKIFTFKEIAAEGNQTSEGIKPLNNPYLKPEPANRTSISSFFDFSVISETSAADILSKTILLQE
jgi:hypothetical protein